MNLTFDELRFIYNMGKECGASKGQEYEGWMFEQMREEYQSMRKFIHFVHMHYPQAMTEYEAVEHIKES